MRALALLLLLPLQSPAQLAETYADAIRELNEDHARKPGKDAEADLAKRLPAAARRALERLLAAKPSRDCAAALLQAGEAALDLDLAGDFERVRARLTEVSPADLPRVGSALSRPRFLLRGMDGIETRYLERFAEVLEGILAAYDEVFGFDEWSKVPGKKLRVRVHLVERITAPPHFAPQFPFHSEIDFPVDDAQALRSPTADGKFLFYGLCHELGHVIAMWGQPARQEDHHAWAHYTGVAIVEHIAALEPAPAWLGELRDARWRSLGRERERLSGVAPSLESEDGVLALLIALHDRVGPRAIGDAIDRLDREDRRLRVNRVRYYGFEALKESLLEGVRAEADRKAVREIFR